MDVIGLCLWLLVCLIGPVFLQETFERAKAWVKELQRQASPNIVIALAGNKADLAERRLVEFEVTHCAISYHTGVAGKALEEKSNHSVVYERTHSHCSAISSYQLAKLCSFDTIAQFF